MGRGWVHGTRVASAAKKGKLFTKLAKEIAVSVKTGGTSSPDANARLRTALKEARENSMPRDTIERAIKRGEGGGEGTQYEEITYEGYGPFGVAVLIETLTDNKNRTVQELRALLVRNSGNLGEPGSVQWMFDRIGSVVAEAPTGAGDPEEAAIMAGANEVEPLDANQFHFISALTDLSTVETSLESSQWKIVKAEPSYKSKNPMSIDESQESELKEFLEAIEDNDDVKKVHLSV